MFGTENGTEQLKKELAIGLTSFWGEPIRYNNTANNWSSNRYEIGICGVIGVRYYLRKKPFFGRLAYTPLYSITAKKLLPFWGSFAIGVNFK